MRARSALVYSLLRLAVFLVPFGLMMLVPILRQYAWLSAIFAALIGLSLSLLFLRGPREELAAGLAARRRGHRVSDEEPEDALVDGATSADERPEQEGPDGERGQ